MTTENTAVSIPDEIISNKIFFVREVKVMLDKDLAELYGVSTGNLTKLSSGISNVFLTILCFNSRMRNLKS